MTSPNVLRGHYGDAQSRWRLGLAAICPRNLTTDIVATSQPAPAGCHSGILNETFTSRSEFRCGMRSASEIFSSGQTTPTLHMSIDTASKLASPQAVQLSFTIHCVTLGVLKSGLKAAPVSRTSQQYSGYRKHLLR